MNIEAIISLNDNYTNALKKILAETGKLNDVLPKASKEADKFNKKLSDVGRNSKGAENQLGSLSNKVMGLIGAYASFQTAMAGLKLSDEIAGSSARLSMITDNLEEQEVLQKKIMQTAKASRGSYIEMANATAKMKMLAGDAFSSNDEALKFTELLNKSLKVTGAGKGEQDAAFLQITQAMASGSLQGDEFRSMTENAPLVANAISKYMGVSRAELKKLSSEGVITSDVVKNALFSATQDIDDKFKTMPKTFADVCIEMQNLFIEKFFVISEKITEILNSESFSNFINGLSEWIDVFIVGVMWALNFVKLLVDNTQIAMPLILGVTAALIAYKVASGLATLVTVGQKVATIGATIAQKGLNAAILACPITWIAVAIVALITLFYVIIGVVNKFAGTSISATGIIVGAFFAMLTPIYNTAVRMWNIFAAVANFLANVFNNPAASIGILFLDLAKSVIDTMANMVKTIEQIINKIPGVKVDISSGITNFSNSIQDKINTIKDESGYKDVVAKKELITLTDGFDKGYKIGEKLGSKLGFGKKDGLGGNAYENTFNTGGGGTGGLGQPNNPMNVKGSGKGGAVKVENNEDIDILRKLAMRDYVVRMQNNTLAPQIKVEFSGPITKEADTGAVLNEVTNILKEAIMVAPEG